MRGTGRWRGRGIGMRVVLPIVVATVSGLAAARGSPRGQAIAVVSTSAVASVTSWPTVIATLVAAGASQNTRGPRLLGVTSLICIIARVILRWKRRRERQRRT
eukprot:Hpha_TRINITY_DN34079_c0_g1::TRINITY_DN34079_c0_g1_i1::g.30598::m.30598